MYRAPAGLPAKPHTHTSRTQGFWPPPFLLPLGPPADLTDLGGGGGSQGFGEGPLHPWCPGSERRPSRPLAVLRVHLPTGVTFSDVVSATEPCKPCTECVGLQSMSAPCVEADDAVCRCAYGYYQDETTGRCEACRVCEAGSGLVFSCQDRQNTVCEECPDGTYSDEANHVDPCLPCTVCEDTERQLRECTRWADAECEGERARPRAPPGGRGGLGRGGWGRPPLPSLEAQAQRTPSHRVLLWAACWECLQASFQASATTLQLSF